MPRPTVLVVEDEPALLAMARVVLERAGFAVLTAADGPAALACHREGAGRVAAVVLDVNLPGLGGWAVLAELRRLQPDLPVIISTGNGADDLTTAGVPDEPTAVLPKPYRPADLVGVVARILAG